MICHFVLLSLALTQLPSIPDWIFAHLFQRHAVLDQQRDSRIQISHIFLEDKVFFRLARDFRLVITLNFLGYEPVSFRLSLSWHHDIFAPRARSSSISKSFSFADMDRYSAVEYLFDCLTDRPSWEETVFWRDMGMSEEDEDVDARDGGMTITDMILRELDEGRFVAKL